MKKTLKIYKFFLIIILIFLSSQIFSQSRIEGEIILGADGTGSNGWYYEWRADFELRWWNDHCLTNNYFSGQTNIIYRPDDEGFAISSPTSSEEHDIAYGIYKFTFICSSLEIEEDFIIDLQDANWSMEHPPYPSPVDLYIRYNNNTGYKKFQYRLTSTGGWNDLGNSQTIWELWHNDPPNQAVFQPSKPASFICSNPGQMGQHPQFLWLQSAGCGGTTVLYKIFRGENSGVFACVDEDIEDNNWTDEEVCIGPRKQGSFFSYYAKAYTGESPESAPSDIASIWANQISKPVGDDSDQFSHNSYQKSNSEATLLKLALSPNPFNSNTTIHYAIPGDGQVRLVVYNIYGQRVVSCVDRSQNAGTYQYHLDGSNLAGGFYLARLQFNNQSLCQKILLLK